MATPYCARLVSELFGPRAEIHVCTHWCRASPFRRFRTIGGVPEASCGICTRLERHHCTVQAWCRSKNRVYGFDAILAQGGLVAARQRMPLSPRALSDTARGRADAPHIWGPQMHRGEPLPVPGKCNGASALVDANWRDFSYLGVHGDTTVD